MFLQYAFIYQLIMLVPFVIFGFNIRYLLIGIISGVTHLLIDLGKIQLTKRNISDVWLYLIDQIFRLTIIVESVFLFSQNSSTQSIVLPIDLVKNILTI